MIFEVIRRGVICISYGKIITPPPCFSFQLKGVQTISGNILKKICILSTKRHQKVFVKTFN